MVNQIHFENVSQKIKEYTINSFLDDYVKIMKRIKELIDQKISSKIENF